MRTPEDTATDPDALLRCGRVQSVDLSAARCTVMLDDEDGAESPPLRWIAPRMGELAKVWLPPSVGEQVVVLCPGGEIGSGLVLGGIACNANPAPIDEPLALIRFSDGAILSYDPEAHELLIQLPAGATTVLMSDGGVDITGNVNITGKVDVSDNVTVTGKVTASVDVVGGGKSLKTHKHGEVTSGTSLTGAPV